MGLRNDDSALRGRLLAVARRFTRNEDDAQDVLQSAYLSAFRALKDFEGTCQLSTWLHRIVVNTALMKLRSRRRNRKSPSRRCCRRFSKTATTSNSFPSGRCLPIS
jgi:RNA polymerase sigma-70 factor (ECF subfamily)